MQFHLVAKTKHGSNLVGTIDAKNMEDALKECSNMILFGKFQSEFDLSRVVQLIITEGQ